MSSSFNEYELCECCAMLNWFLNFLKLLFKENDTKTVTLCLIVVFFQTSKRNILCQSIFFILLELVWSNIKHSFEDLCKTNNILLQRNGWLSPIFKLIFSNQIALYFTCSNVFNRKPTVFVWLVCFYFFISSNYDIIDFNWNSINFIK